MNLRLLICLFITFDLLAQSPSTPPKLIVGIVIDQMRADYLTRYADRYCDGGFRRMQREGFEYSNMRYHYVPTYTGPGHASIFTGCPPSVHGICGNNWFDRKENKTVYCTDDPAARGTGSLSAAGKMSPRHELAPTLGDELKLYYTQRSKVIGIALKDRASILPAGHNADAAYWYEKGSFISSKWYLDTLPAWVIDFNEAKHADKACSSAWTTLFPVNTYKASLSDNNPYEGTFIGETAPVFPHNIPELMQANGGLNIIRGIPAGNTLTRKFAEAAISGEQLGADAITDLLAISFSSTDYVGHRYGIDAIETEDTYLRLDRELDTLFRFLDARVGKDRYLVFLTADHAGQRTANYLRDQKIPGGIIDEKSFADSLRSISKRLLGADYIAAWENQQIYFTTGWRSQCSTEKIRAFMRELSEIDFVDRCIFADDLYGGHAGMDYLAKLILAGAHPKRSGDVFVNFIHGYTEYQPTGTTHGSPYPYDTHVPFLMMGSGIKNGRSLREVSIIDIAPTVSVLCGFPIPGAATGAVLQP